MIVKDNKQSEVFTSGIDQGSIKMSLDTDSSGFLMQVLSKNIYQDSIGSLIRELTSNAVDSVRRVKGDDPVIVSLYPVAGGSYEFSVEDFGLGLDDQDVIEILSKYGKSTKRDSADELGLFGIGFKSPLSYTSSFTFTCVKDGMERAYMMYEGEELNEIAPLYERPTDRRNGVKVVVPVKYNDVKEFYDKIKEQLAYFENVFINVNCYIPYYGNGSITNDFKIYRGDEFQWSELCNDKCMHISMDNVYYPIDFEKLGITRINIPVALKFGLTDGIYPTANRESIRYTSEAKAILMDKIKKVADYLVSEYNNITVTKDNDVLYLHMYYSKKDRYVMINNTVLNIADIVGYSSVPMKAPKLDGISHIDINSCLNNELVYGYRCKLAIRYGKTRAVSEIMSFSTAISENSAKKILIKSLPRKMMIKYLKEAYPGGRFSDSIKFYEKVGKRHLFKQSASNLESYYEVLSLKDHPRSEWRIRIKEYQLLEKYIIDGMTKLEDIVIPQEWIDSQKVSRAGMTSAKRVTKLTGDINFKEAADLERYSSGRNCKFVPDMQNAKNFVKFNGLIIYTHHDKYTQLDSIYGITKRDMKFKLITLSDRELSVISKVDNHNIMSYETFMKGHNKPFKRLVTAQRMKELYDDFTYVFNSVSIVKRLSKSLADDMDFIKDYIQSYQCSINTDTMESMLVTADESNLYDTVAYGIYNRVKNVLERLYFLNTLSKMVSIKGGYYYSNTVTINALEFKLYQDMCRRYKFRMDYENYLTNNSKEEEILTI